VTALAPRPAPALTRPRLLIGHVPIDVLGFAEALDAIERLVAAGAGGGVFTPNVDHVVQAQRDPAFREAYAAAALSLVDGTPLLWASRLLGRPLPEKISGSDLLAPLAALAGRARWRVHVLGAPRVVGPAAEVLARRYDVQVVGIDAPVVRLGEDQGDEARAAAERVRAARPHLVLVGFGAPKQELWIHRHRAELGPAVAVGVGAGLEFLAGLARRAPPWMSRCGLEWLHRLAQDPRRLWRRYLVDDPRIVAIVIATWLRARRAREATS
jgi:N-acetylglucosaminyldiphosphoundecaprenol N-acetyl-beta-D-mannosaminyltransferase